jgi:hypothetical protein
MATEESNLIAKDPTNVAKLCLNNNSFLSPLPRLKLQSKLLDNLRVSFSFSKHISLVNLLHIRIILWSGALLEKSPVLQPLKDLPAS